MTSTALVSSTADMQGDYRYSLARVWDPTLEPLVFILLNPSTADETANDPTVTRCIGHARRLGYGGLIVVNLYAYRATDPRVMLKAADPVGPHNDQAIVEAVTGRTVIAAWGTNAKPGRVREVLELIPPTTSMFVLQLTPVSRVPQHPLYVGRSVTPIPWAG